MEDLWFEDDLIPPDLQANPQTLKNIITLNLSGREVREHIEAVRGILRVQKPRWIELQADASAATAAGGKFLIPDKTAKLYLIRLGFEFDLSDEAKAMNAHFIYARCAATLSPGGDGQPMPCVYDIEPKTVYEGEQRKIGIKLSPSLKVLEHTDISLGEISTDIAMGWIEPAVTGFLGDDQRDPYWTLEPRSKSLIGIKHFWIIVEAPTGCDGLKVSVSAFGRVKTPYFSMIPLGSTSGVSNSSQQALVK